MKMYFNTKKISILAFLTATNLIILAPNAYAASIPTEQFTKVSQNSECKGLGVGYFAVPSSSTCIKISGYAEADGLTRTTHKFTDFTGNGDFVGNGSATAGISPVSAASRNNNTLSIDSEIQLDAITESEFGRIHSYIAYELTKGVSGSSNPTAGTLDGAYLEFNGLTAGNHESFFHNIGSRDHLYANVQTPDYKTNLIAYTAAFSKGFSASVSVEDATFSRAPTPIGDLEGSGTDALATVRSQRLPDVIGALRLNQSWGETSLIGGYHQTPYNDASGNHAAKGYAIAGFVSLNLPMLAAEDTVSFQAIYEKNTLAMGGFTNANLSSYNGWQNNPVDVFLGHNQTGFTILADFIHNWTPVVSTEIEGSYGSVRYAGLNSIDINFFNYDTSSYNILTLGQVTKWHPVKGLEFGIDTTYTLYRNIQNGDATAGITTPGLGGQAGICGWGVAKAYFFCKNLSQNDVRVQMRARRTF
eukprot:gene13415-13529_t